MFFGNYDSYFIFITISWLNKSNYVYVNVTLTWNETPIVCFHIIKTRKPPTFYICIKKAFPCSYIILFALLMTQKIFSKNKQTKKYRITLIYVPKKSNDCTGSHCKCIDVLIIH